MDFAYYVLVDVFSDRPFAGNQLAVFPDGSMVSSECMQKFARELNLAETVFVLPPQNPQNQFKFRIFTPLAELPFAGHPTVGTACALAELGFVKMTAGEAEITVEEGAGPVRILIRKVRDLFAAQFSVPLLPESRPGVPDRAALAAMLSLEVQEVEDAQAFSCGMPFLFVPVKNREVLSRIRLNTAVWERETAGAWAREVYAFAREGNQIFSRMFAPRLGIPEDPGTGAAAAALAGFLAAGETQDRTLSWTILQGVELGRPSVISLEADLKTGRISDVRVGGKTVHVGEGKMRIVL